MPKTEEKTIQSNLSGRPEKDRFLFEFTTDIGIKNIYNAASQCNRCGYCFEVCPSYIVLRQENYSARGRNHIVKMTAESRLNYKADAEEIYDSLSKCLLCGGCTSACYGKVATSKSVLEVRRVSPANKVSKFAKFTLETLAEKPKLFSFLFKLFNFCRKFGLVTILQKTKILKITGMYPLYRAHKIFGKPVKFLKKTISKNSEKTKCLYFVSCTANYIRPKTAKASLNILNKVFGSVKLMQNPCCGLLAFNYLDLETAKKQAKKIISLYEKFAEGENIPLVTDCSSCAAHLKNYPDMFYKDKMWYERAVNFARNVKDVAEIIIEKVKHKQFSKKAFYHHSSDAYHKQNINPVNTFNFTEINESAVACGGETGFAFSNPVTADKILERKIYNIAAAQSDTLLSTDGFSLSFIEYGLKRYYPFTKAMHLSEFINSELFENG